jgi:hypothetical protein
MGTKLIDSTLMITFFNKKTRACGKNATSFLTSMNAIKTQAQILHFQIIATALYR